MNNYRHQVRRHEPEYDNMCSDCPGDIRKKHFDDNNSDCKHRCSDKSNKYISNCQCLDELPLGIAYVPWQIWNNIYTAEEGMEAGTIFPELVMPFYGCNKIGRGNRG